MKRADTLIKKYKLPAEDAPKLGRNSPMEKGFTRMFCRQAEK